MLSLKRAALDDLVLDELIYREAVAAGRRPSTAAIEAEVASARSRFESDQAFAAALRKNGLDEAAFRERLGRAVLVREACDARSRPEITEADLAAYYRDNGPKFQRSEQVRLRQILFRVDPADPAKAGPAESKARAAMDRLRRGEPFGQLARLESEDEYRVKDGEMGLVHRGRLDREFEDAAFAAPVGQMQLARSLHGFEVFEVLERRPPVQLTFEQARPIIAARLARQRRVEGLRAWKARLLATARLDAVATCGSDPEAVAGLATDPPPAISADRPLPAAGGPSADSLDHPSVAAPGAASPLASAADAARRASAAVRPIAGGKSRSSAAAPPVPAGIAVDRLRRRIVVAEQVKRRVQQFERIAGSGC